MPEPAPGGAAPGPPPRALKDDIVWHVPQAALFEGLAERSQRWEILVWPIVRGGERPLVRETHEAVQRLFLYFLDEHLSTEELATMLRILGVKAVGLYQYNVGDV